MNHSHRGRSTRRNVAALLSPLVATAGLTGVASPASAAVTIGDNITAFPNRDMVVVSGYEPGEELTVEVVRNGLVIGTAQGPAVEIPDGIGLEVNHGPLGDVLPGDCWNGVTPNIVGGDVIRVTASNRGVDEMVVQDFDFIGDPYLEDDGDVAVKGEAAAGVDFAVEFRRDKPTPRFRRGPFVPVFDAADPTGRNWTTAYEPTATSTEGLTADQQRTIALNTASWLAVSDNITDTTIAELGEPGGVGPGCTGSADPNAIGGGLAEPINVASGDIVVSGTARAGVGVVSVKFGALAAKEITLSATSTETQTWSVPFTKTELLTLPDGNVTVTPSFDGVAGASRTILKDTSAPAASPTATPPAGRYTSTQSVALNKPTGEATSRVVYEIGSPGQVIPDPDEASTLFAPGSPISVTSTQTIKARVVDAAGNLGPVGTFAYTIGTAAPAAPTGVQATAGSSQATVSWTAPDNGGSPITGYVVETYEGAAFVRSNTFNTTATSVIVRSLTNGTAYNFKVKAVNALGQGELSAASPVVTPQDTTAPTTPTLTGSVTGTTASLSWTASTDNVAVTGYRVFRNGLQVGAPAGRTFSQTNLAAGTYSYTVRAIDAAGNLSAASQPVSLTVSSVAPGAPTIGAAVAGDLQATVNWTAPTSDGGAAITEYRIQVRTGTTVVRTVTGVAGTANSSIVTGLTNGTAYNFRVRAVNSAGVGVLSAASAPVTPAGAVTATRPGAPVIGTAVAGAAGGAITATANWAPPTDTGGAAINGYIVRGIQFSSTGAVVSTTTSAVLPATARSFSMTLPAAANYRFTVQARNSEGTGVQSTRSNLVAGR